MKIRKSSKRPVRASRRAVKASSSYYEVVRYVDGVPAEIKMLDSGIRFRVVEKPAGFKVMALAGGGNFDYSIETYSTPEEAADAMIRDSSTFRNRSIWDESVQSSRKVSCSAKRRVMAAKRSIHFTVTVTDTDEIIDVLEDQDEAIEVARKYTQKYGDSATVEKEWIGSDGEVYDSTVCFQTDSDFNSSTKIAKRPIKASRPIMAGAGAGITLELADLTFTEVPNSGFYGDYNEYHEFLEPENGACKGTIEIKSIGTYYDGGIPNTGVIPVSIFVEEVIPYDAEDAQQMMGGTLKDVIDEFDEFEPTIRIGGGWTRVTFDGTFEVEGYSGYTALKLKVEIEDKDIVRWLDLFAHGEADELYYDICINDNPNGDYYYSQEDAIATAKEYAADPDYADDEITVVMRHYSTDYNGDDMYLYDDDGDVVWSSEDDLYE